MMEDVVIEDRERKWGPKRQRRRDSKCSEDPYQDRMSRVKF